MDSKLHLRDRRKKLTKRLKKTTSASQLLSSQLVPIAESGDEDELEKN